MLPLTIAEIVQATQGLLVMGDPRKTVGLPESSENPASRPQGGGFSIDSRTVMRGDVFFAIQGDRFDGHDFLNETMLKGAYLCVVSKMHSNLVIPSSSYLSVIKVKDTKKALNHFAKYYRKKYGEKTDIIGISGSTGKTTVKEMAAQILNRVAPTAYTAGNLNNEIGCPVSLLSLAPHHRFGVFEIGASGKGEVGRLAEMVSPRMAVITNIGLEHTATFGTIEEIAEGESEILPCLSGGGWAVLPADDSFFRFLKSRIPADKEIKIKSFGFSHEASVSATNISLWPAPTKFTLVHQSEGKKILESIDCTLPVMGRFNVLNACAAAAATLCLGVPADAIREGLAHFSPPKMRFQIIELENGATIINDSYNANPKSMRASLESFVDSFPHSERSVVLADMLEMGEVSRSEHYALGQFLAGLPLSKIILYGSQSRFVFDGAKDCFANEKSIVYCPDINSVIEKTQPLLKRGQAILFKGSRGMHLDEVIQKVAPVSVQTA